MMGSRIATLYTVAVTLLIVKVTANVVIGYRDYLPPNFQADFLLGRQSYFWGGYACAFYTHLFAGPTSLLLGLVLLNNRFRTSWPRWHRLLGRVQVAIILLLLVPSGLWMACYAATGAVAGWGLVLLAFNTAICATMGWRRAVQRHFAEHRLWMARTFVLLGSAVVIRLIGGAAEAARFDALWLYPLSAWASWLVALAVFELVVVGGSFRQRDRPKSGLLPASSFEKETARYWIPLKIMALSRIWDFLVIHRPSRRGPLYVKYWRW